MPVEHAALWRDLDRRIAGQVITPNDAGYDQARAVPNARYGSARPHAVVQCAHARDVAATLRALHGAGMVVSIRSGGHCFAGRSSSGDVIVDVSRLKSITVTGNTVRVGAGVRLGDLYAPLAAHGRAIVGGNGSTVGVSGLTLGGGLGILGRRHGLTCDTLREAEVVLAGGQLVNCSNEQMPDLFWALRGAGGGRFGVVTSLTLQTVNAPAMTAFEIRWSYRHAARVLDAWQAFAPDVARDVAASLLLTAPANPAVEPAVTVAGTMAADDTTTRGALRPLIAAIDSAPSAQDYTFTDFRTIKRRLEPADINLDHRTYIRSQFHDQPLPADTVDALVSNIAVARQPGHVRELDFTPWAGAYGDVAPDATAFPHRHDRFLLKHSVAVPIGLPTRADAPAQAWLADSFGATATAGTGRVYPNFPDPELARSSDAYFASNLPRLRAIQTRYDPDRRFDAL